MEKEATGVINACDVPLDHFESSMTGVHVAALALTHLYKVGISWYQSLITISPDGCSKRSTSLPYSTPAYPIRHLASPAYWGVGLCSVVRASPSYCGVHA
jgi:hypothetical protein